MSTCTDRLDDHAMDFLDHDIVLRPMFGRLRYGQKEFNCGETNEMKKILICGDSYAITDPDFPGLHWTEKMLDKAADIEVWNFAYGGASNGLICLQLLQGLEFDPDFVIMIFTDHTRYEVDRDTEHMPYQLDQQALIEHMKQRYTTNMYTNLGEKNDIINNFLQNAVSDEFAKLKNYFLISFCLQTLEQRGIPFCYSLGGFEHFQQNYKHNIRTHFHKDLFDQYTSKEIPINLCYGGPQVKRPYFHVTNPAVHELFANFCMEQINQLILD